MKKIVEWKIMRGCTKSQKRMLGLKAILFVLALCLIPGKVSAQRITRQYNNVSFSAALKDLNARQDKYAINFVYDELEDFKVTKSIRNQSIPDAIMQLIGFYPIKMTQMENVIMVECTQKAPTKMIGRVLDSHQHPVDFANVALLNVRDSTLITGGVTNENGQFVIPCEARKAIVKVSCVGYKTVYHAYSTGKIGNIVLHENTVLLKSVNVNAMRHNIKMGQEGLTVNIENSELAKVGTAKDLLREMPRVDMSPDGSVSVFAKGTPLIYINNKQVRDAKELEQLKSDNVKNVEIITAPGAKYDATVKSVIRIKTIKKQGEGWSGKNFMQTSYNNRWSGFEDLELNYRTGKLELFGETWLNTSASGEDNILTNKLNGSKNIVVEQAAPLTYRYKGADVKVGFDYSFNDDNTLGMTYEYNDASGKGNTNGSYQNIMEEGIYTARVDELIKIKDTYGPTHNVNAFYMGKIGRLGIDFNGTFLSKKQGRMLNAVENSNEIESRNVHTNSMQHSRMLAGKLVLSYPIWNGTMNFGSEITSSRIKGEYANEEEYVEASNTEIKENNLAGFAEYVLPLGHLSLNAGVRYEHVWSDYYSFGKWQEEPSRRYSNWFPSATISWSKDKWNISLAYTNKTSRPSYNSLRNEVQYDNRYTYEGGNPYIKPSVVSNVDFNVLYGWLSLNGGYNYIDKPIVWAATLYQGKDIVFLRNLNFSHSQDLYASLVAEPRFGWYNPMFEIDYNQTFLSVSGFDIGGITSKPSFRFKCNNRFNIGSTMKAFLNMKYRTSVHDGLQYDKPYASIDVRLSKTFIKETLQVSLFANDLLRTDKEKWTMYGSHVQLSKDCYAFARCIGLSVNYNFNATKSKYKGTGAGNAEKSRL